MTWAEITRRQYARPTARYASDMTDREWLLMEPFLPMPHRLGRPRTTDLREVVNALLLVGLMVHSADIQDRDGAPDLLKSIRHRWAMVAACLYRWWLCGRQAEAAAEEDRALDD